MKSRLNAWAAAGLISGALIFVETSASAQDSMPTAVGVWEKLSESGRPEGHFQIYPCGNMFCGKIIKIFPKPGEVPSQWRCTGCKGKQKNAPVVGITFIEGMKRDGLRYGGGTILDPRDGSTYNALMELSPDGNQLTVRGYLIHPMLGKSEVWQRVSEQR